MITNNLETLKIHKLSKEQYDRELASGNIDENALYLTPDEELDLSGYATMEEVSLEYETKADATSKLTSAKQYTDQKIAAVNETMGGLASATHTHDDRYYTEAEMNVKLDEKSDKTHTHSADDVDADAKGTAESKVNTHNTAENAHEDIRSLVSTLTSRLNALADSDDITLDQMSELVAYIKENRSLIDSVTTAKINVSDIVNNLTTNVKTKVLGADQGVVLKGLIDALQASLGTHTDNTVIHVTDTQKTNWDQAYNHSKEAHAPSDAEKNQNAFSNVKVGNATIASKTVADTIELSEGDNVTITPDATNKKITITAKDTVYTHPNSGVGAGTYRSVTVDEQGHVTAGTSPTTLDGYGITDAARKDHAHEVDEALSPTSVNPVQNKVVNEAFSAVTSAVSANTSSISSHTERITNLETQVGDGFEAITAEEIQALFTA